MGAEFADWDNGRKSDGGESEFVSIKEAAKYLSFDDNKMAQAVSHGLVKSVRKDGQILVETESLKKFKDSMEGNVSHGACPEKYREDAESVETMWKNYAPKALKNKFPSNEFRSFKYVRIDKEHWRITYGEIGEYYFETYFVRCSGDDVEVLQ